VRLTRPPARLFTVLAFLLLSGCTGAKFTPGPAAASYPPFTGKVRVLDRFPTAGTFDRIGVVMQGCWTKRRTRVLMRSCCKARFQASPIETEPGSFDSPRSL
jgi:hypothetical protein